MRLTAKFITNPWQMHSFVQFLALVALIFVRHSSFQRLSQQFRHFPGVDEPERWKNSIFYSFFLTKNCRWHPNNKLKSNNNHEHRPNVKFCDKMSQKSNSPSSLTERRTTAHMHAQTRLLNSQRFDVFGILLYFDNDGTYTHFWSIPQKSIIIVVKSSINLHKKCIKLISKRWSIDDDWYCGRSMDIFGRKLQFQSDPSVSLIPTIAPPVIHLGLFLVFYYSLPLNLLLLAISQQRWKKTHRRI